MKVHAKSFVSPILADFGHAFGIPRRTNSSKSEMAVHMYCFMLGTSPEGAGVDDCFRAKLLTHRSEFLRVPKGSPASLFEEFHGVRLKLLHHFTGPCLQIICDNHAN